MIVITLKEHLIQLQRKELSRPKHERKHVPNFSQLADMSGLTFKTISKLANNRSKNFNLRTGDLIISALRHAGFSTKLSDIITYQERENRS